MSTSRRLTPSQCRATLYLLLVEVEAVGEIQAQKGEEYSEQEAPLLALGEAVEPVGNLRSSQHTDST